MKEVSNEESSSECDEEGWGLTCSSLPPIEVMVLLLPSMTKSLGPVIVESFVIFIFIVAAREEKASSEDLFLLLRFISLLVLVTGPVTTLTSNSPRPSRTTASTPIPSTQASHTSTDPIGRTTVSPLSLLPSLTPYWYDKDSSAAVIVTSLTITMADGSSVSAASAGAASASASGSGSCFFC